MILRCLALAVALVAAQPSVVWALQIAALDRQAHCTDEFCHCNAGQQCPSRRLAAKDCHEATAPQTAISGACNHGFDAAPLTAARYVMPAAPVLAPIPVSDPLAPWTAEGGLAGHIEIHSPPPRSALS